MIKMAKKKYLALIGLILFLFILLQLNVGMILKILFSANLFYVIAAFACTLIVVSMKAIKWRYVIRAHEKEISIYDSFKFFCIGFSISTLTPGRIGEFIKAFYIRDRMPLAVGLSTVVIDRLIDIILLITLGTISIIAFGYLFGIIIIPIHFLLLGIIIFIVSILIFLRGKYMKIFVNPFIELIVPQRFKEKFRMNLSLFYSSFKQALKNRNMLLIVILMALLYWFISMMFAYFAALSLDISIPFYFVALFVPIIALLDLIPISISSIGTRDIALIFFLSIYSIAAESAVAFSLLYLFIGHITIALIGAIFFIRNPVEFNVFKQID